MSLLLSGCGWCGGCCAGLPEHRLLRRHRRQGSAAQIRGGRRHAATVWSSDHGGRRTAARPARQAALGRFWSADLTGSHWRIPDRHLLPTRICFQDKTKNSCTVPIHITNVSIPNLIHIVRIFFLRFQFTGSAHIMQQSCCYTFSRNLYIAYL